MSLISLLSRLAGATTTQFLVPLLPVPYRINRYANTCPPSYQFNLSYHADLPPIHCEAMGTTLSEDLGSIPQTYCESESTGVSFQWTRNSDNTSDLLVVREVDDVNQMTDEAIYHVSSNDTPLLGEGLFAHMVYTGPEDFSVPAFRFSV